MPALADPTTWRKSHAYRGWVVIDQPEAVFKARVNMSTITYPCRAITFDGVTLGAYTDATAGLTLLLGSSEGADDLGRIRLRKDSTSNTLYPGEVSQGARHGELNLSDDAYLTVLNWRIPFVFAPYIDPTTEIVYKDYDLPVVDGGRNYASEFGPIANGGCAKADNIDSVTSLATFEFDSDNSLYVTPGSSKASVTWDVIDGTITVGTANSDQITATFPEGRRYVTLTVEDDGGNTHTHYILTLACNPDGSTLRPLLDFEIIDHRLSVEGGELAVKVFEDVDPTDYPEGAQIIYYEHEYYGGVKGSLAGPSGDEHIKFVGWLDGEMESPTATLRGIENGVEFRAVSTAARMQQLNLFPQRVDDSNSPTKWTQMLDLTPQRFMLYLLRWHSNICDIANVQLAGYGSGYEGLQTQSSTLYEQVDEIAQEYAQRFTCDQRSTLRIIDNPLLLDSGDRTSTTIVALTEADISEYTLDRVWMPREYWIDAEGITLGNSQASVFSRAQGDAPGQGATRSAFDKQLVADQSELNARSGHEYARRNKPWEPLRLTMVNTGDAGIDPALMEWIEVTTTASKNRRQRALTDQRCLPTEVQIVHSNDGRGVREVEYVAEIETVGTPGATYIPRTDPQVKLPAYQYPPFDLYPATWEAPAASQSVDFTSAPAMYGYTPSGVYRNRDTSSISWAQIFTPAAGYTLYDFALDPWNPKNGAWVVVIDANVSLRVYSTDNLDDSPPTWSLEEEVAYSGTGSGFVGATLALSINVEGYVAVFYGISLTPGPFDTVDARWLYRETPVSSWDNVLINQASRQHAEREIGMGTHQIYPNGDIYVSVSRNDASAYRKIYKSTDLGATWALDEDVSAYLGGFSTLCITLPNLNNPGDEIAYFFTGETDSDCLFRRNADGSYTFGLGPPATSGYFYIPATIAGFRHPTAEIWTGNPNYIRFISANQDGTSYRQLVYSENGGGVWVNKSLPTIDVFWGIGSWPNDANVLFVYGNGVLYWSANKGDAWASLRGDGVSADDLFVLATDDRLLGFAAVWVP